MQVSIACPSHVARPGEGPLRKRKHLRGGQRQRVIGGARTAPAMRRNQSERMHAHHAAMISGPSQRAALLDLPDRFRGFSASRLVRARRKARPDWRQGQDCSSVKSSFATAHAALKMARSGDPPARIQRAHRAHQGTTPMMPWTSILSQLASQSTQPIRSADRRHRAPPLATGASARPTMADRAIRCRTSHQVEARYRAVHRPSSARMEEIGCM